MANRYPLILNASAGQLQELPVGDTLDLGGEGVVGIGLGSAGAPSLSFDGDGDTGLYSPGANQVAISTNGTGRLFVDASGWVGVGTLLPAKLLHVSGSGTQAIRLENTAGTGNAVFEFKLPSHTLSVGLNSSSSYFSDSTASPFVLYQAGSERLRVDSSGRLLVGTGTAPTTGGQAPYARISCFGNTYDNTAAGYINIGRNETAANMSSNNGVGGLIFADSAGGQFAQIDCFADALPGLNDYPGRLVFSTTADGASSPTERMRIDSSGNVDIGSAVSGGYVSGALIQSGGKIASYVSNSTAGSDQRIYVYNGSTSTYTASINADGSASFAGRVGIGTTSPSGLLHISGNTCQMYFTDEDDASSSRIYQSGATFAIDVDQANAKAGSVFAIRSDDQERLRIDSSGRLLVGTTTEGAVNADNLTINDPGDAGITIRSSSTNAGSLFFSDSTTGGGEYAGYLQYDHGSNYLAIGTNSTERLRIDSSGNVGIGTTAPNYLVHSTGAIGVGASGLYQQQLSIGNNAIQSLVLGVGYTDMSLNALGGNVGIGTASPGAILHLSSADPVLRITDSSGTSSNLQGQVLFQAGVGGSAVGKVGYTGSDAVLRVHTTGAQPVAFGTNDAERMRIDSSGRLLLNGGSDVRMELGTNGTTGTNDRNHIRADGDNLKYNTCDNGQHIFEENGTERMRIDSSGRVWELALRTLL